MAEKYLKCPNCGADNPEGKKFCGECGTMIPIPPPPPPVQPMQSVYAQSMQPMYAQPKKSWPASNWKALTAVIIVVAVVLASLGLVYSQPWSKIKILARNTSGQSASYLFQIDGVEKARGTILPGDYVTIGVWSVKTGSHTVRADCHYLGQLGPSLDGVMEYSYDYSVGLLYTKNAFITLDPETPDLVGDLTLYYDNYNDEVSVEGKVFNYGNVPCYGTLTYTVQDTRGWSLSDTILLGRIGADGTYVEVSRTHDWPYSYGGQSNYNIVPTWTYSLTFS